MVIQRIKNWFKPPEVLKPEVNINRDDHVLEEQKPKPSYACDVCKEPAKHIAIVDSDTGRHVIGAKCDEHIAMVMRKMKDEVFTGTRMDNTPVHFAGFKSDPYSEWFECSCPKGTTHYILSDDVRLLNKRAKR